MYGETGRPQLGGESGELPANHVVVRFQGGGGGGGGWGTEKGIQSELKSRTKQQHWWDMITVQGQQHRQGQQ